MEGLPKPFGPQSLTVNLRYPVTIFKVIKPGYHTLRPVVFPRQIVLTIPVPIFNYRPSWTTNTFQFVGRNYIVPYIINICCINLRICHVPLVGKREKNSGYTQVGPAFASATRIGPIEMNLHVPWCFDFHQTTALVGIEVFPIRGVINPSVNSCNPEVILIPVKGFIFDPCPVRILKEPDGSAAYVLQNKSSPPPSLKVVVGDSTALQCFAWVLDLHRMVEGIGNNLSIPGHPGHRGVFADLSFLGNTSKGICTAEPPPRSERVVFGGDRVGSGSSPIVHHKGTVKDFDLQAIVVQVSTKMIESFQNTAFATQADGTFYILSDAGSLCQIKGRVWISWPKPNYLLKKSGCGHSRYLLRNARFFSSGRKIPTVIPKVSITLINFLPILRGKEGDETGEEKEPQEE